MSKSIKELRTQRELIQKHLNWLDTQIRNAQGAQKNEDNLSPVEHVSRMPAQASNHNQINIEAPAKPGAAAQVHHEVEETLIEYSGSSDIKRAKIGCMVFFAALTLLFLFLLFVLPYLLN